MSDDVAACAACLRRTRLLELLAPHVERVGRGRRLAQLLALEDDALLTAIGGRRRTAIAAELAQHSSDASRVALAAAGLAARCRHDARYPRRLAVADDAPAMLSVAGDPAALDALATEGALAVAIVGARRATAQGLEVARVLGRALAAARITVVSGMALGIDSAAHAGALEAGGPTIAVLAGGADRPYPPSKRALYRAIAGGGGCVVSEMPPAFTPFTWGFPARNRIIAGLADMTIVVEAAERSGSLITAELAQELGRLVGAVPGPVGSPMSAGANALLRDGADVVRGAQDVLDSLLGPGVARAPRGPDAGTLEPRLRELLERLGVAPAGPGALAAPGEPVDAVAAGLAELELAGFARRLPGGRYVASPS